MAVKGNQTMQLTFAGASGVLLAACLAGCTSPVAGDVAAPPDVPVAATMDEPILPLPEVVRVKPALAALGARLFEERALSKDGSMSCATCHPLGRTAVDGLVRSPTVGGGLTGANTPTLFNVVFNFRFSWTGQQRTLEEQVEVAITRAMGQGAGPAAATLALDPVWRARFVDVFGEPPTGAGLRAALAEFQRSLVTPNAPLDRWLRGDATALTSEQQEGYALFKELGCASCHQGRNVGGNMFQRMGVMADYFAARGGPALPADLGRYEETHQEEDRHVFRVPSLRNVEKTAPYLHDGYAATMDDAVRIMAANQLGRTLSDRQVALLVAFLRSLTAPDPQPFPGGAP